MDFDLVTVVLWSDFKSDPQLEVRFVIERGIA